MTKEEYLKEKEIIALETIAKTLKDIYEILKSEKVGGTNGDA